MILLFDCCLESFWFLVRTWERDYSSATSLNTQNLCRLCASLGIKHCRAVEGTSIFFLDVGRRRLPVQGFHADRSMRCSWWMRQLQSMSAGSGIAIILFSLNLALPLRSSESLLQWKSQRNGDENFSPLHLM